MVSQAKKAFTYVGGKSALVKFYTPPPVGIKRIVEPFAGSMAYSLAHNLPALGFDTSLDLVILWKWLKNTTAKELNDINDIYTFSCSNLEPGQTLDVRDLGLDAGPSQYIRVNCAGLITGQFSKFSIHPRNKLPIEQTIKCLESFKKIDVIWDDGLKYKASGGDLLFIDPPCIESNFKKNKIHIRASDITNMIQHDVPTIFTYGNNANILFPDREWKVIYTKKYKNIRTCIPEKHTVSVSYSGMFDTLQ